MRAVVVLGQEKLKEGDEFLVILPGFVLQPLFESAHKTFGNTIRLGSVAGDENMNEFCLTHEGAKGIGAKMDAPVRNQKEQVRRKQEFEGLDNPLAANSDPARCVEAPPGARSAV